jgi:hypothetical protein
MCFLCISITVTLAFKVILNKVLYNIATHIKNSIDILIDDLEIENGHFSQTGDNCDACLRKCPSVGIWRLLFAHLLSQVVILFLNSHFVTFIRGSIKKYVDNVAPLQSICQKFKINTKYFILYKFYECVNFHCKWSNGSNINTFQN